MRLVRGRLAAVSIRSLFGAGAWVGFGLGVVAGALLGALLSWLAGAVVGWQRDLAVTLGVTRSLLPFGDQVATLEWLNASWYLVVPVAALALGVVWAIIGGIVGSLLAAAYNLSPRHATIIVEVPDGSAEDGAPDPGTASHPDRALARRG
jgi:hypothetical protein